MLFFLRILIFLRGSFQFARHRQFGTVVLVLFSSFAISTPTFATSESTDTLRERIARGDAVIFARWISAEEESKTSRGSTIFEIISVTRSPSEEHFPGTRIVFDRYHPGEPGGLALLTGTTATKTGELSLYWPIDLTDVSRKYIADAPSANADLPTIVSYYANFLEHDEPLISKDAYLEFSNPDFRDLAPLAGQFPRENLRRWIVNPKTPPHRLDLYGWMLGLCGNEADATEIEKRFVLGTQAESDFGRSGVLGCYLMLTGKRGLNRIEANLIKNHDVSFAEVYSAMRALTFCRQYGAEKIAPQRLDESMRLFLDRPDMADIAISNLERYRDWSVQARLMELYGTSGYDSALTKRVIIRYLIFSTRDAPKDANKGLPEHVTRGKEYLQQLRERDKEFVTRVEKQVGKYLDLIKNLDE